MKNTKNFTLDTPLTEMYGSRKGKVYGYARITGVGYWNPYNQEDWDNQECELDSIASFDIESVTLLVDGSEESGYLAYNLSKKFGDAFADIIDKATLAHMEYLFSADYSKNETVEVEHTDMTQDERKYAVTMLIEAPKEDIAA